MKHIQKFSVLLLRLSLGWVMLYGGITKIMDPSWSAKSFLLSAQTFPEFYAWFAQPHLLPYVNLLNEWGLALIGASLILGVFVPISAFFGAALMMLYYFPDMQFPMVGEHALIVDFHFIYAICFLVLMGMHAGRYMGIDKRIAERMSFFRHFT